jgi:hypothetical protein
MWLFSLGSHNLALQVIESLSIRTLGAISIHSTAKLITDSSLVSVFVISYFTRQSILQKFLSCIALTALLSAF